MVRGGDDYKISKGGHRSVSVFTEMFLQISTDYNGLPDGRTLKISEIVFYYNGLRNGLKQATRPRK